MTDQHSVGILPPRPPPRAQSASAAQYSSSSKVGKDQGEVGMTSSSAGGGGGLPGLPHHQIVRPSTTSSKNVRLATIEHRHKELEQQIHIPLPPPSVGQGLGVSDIHPLVAYSAAPGGGGGGNTPLDIVGPVDSPTATVGVVDTTSNVSSIASFSTPLVVTSGGGSVRNINRAQSASSGITTTRQIHTINNTAANRLGVPSPNRGGSRSVKSSTQTPSNSKGLGPLDATANSEQLFNGTVNSLGVTFGEMGVLPSPSNNNSRPAPGSSSTSGYDNSNSVLGHRVLSETFVSDIGSLVHRDEVDALTGEKVPVYMQDELKALREQITRLVLDLKKSEGKVAQLQEVNDSLRQKNTVLQTFSRVGASAAAAADQQSSGGGDSPSPTKEIALNSGVAQQKHRQSMVASSPARFATWVKEGATPLSVPGPAAFSRAGASSTELHELFLMKEGSPGEKSRGSRGSPTTAANTNLSSNTITSKYRRMSMMSNISNNDALTPTGGGAVGTLTLQSLNNPKGTKSNRPSSAVGTRGERGSVLPQVLANHNENLVRHLEDLEEEGRLEAQGHQYELAHMEARLDEMRAEKDAFANQTADLNKRVAEEVLLKRQIMRLENANAKFQSSRLVRMAGMARMEAVERLAMEAHDDLLTLKRTQSLEDIPLGEACLVMVDMCGYLTLKAEFPSLVPFVLKKFHEKLLSACNKFNGYEIKIKEDVGFFSFFRVHEAVQFAAGLQLEMMKEDWPESLLHHDDFARVGSPADSSIICFCGPRVRAGMYFCSPSVEFDNRSGRFCYFGREVATTGFITSQAMPGEVRLSSGTFTRLQQELATLKLTADLLGVHVDKVKIPPPAKPTAPPPQPTQMDKDVAAVLGSAATKEMKDAVTAASATLNTLPNLSMTTKDQKGAAGEGSSPNAQNFCYAIIPLQLVERRRLWSHERLLKDHSSSLFVEERQIKMQSSFWTTVTHVGSPAIIIAPKIVSRNREYREKELAALRAKREIKPTTQLQKEAINLLGAEAFLPDSPSKKNDKRPDPSGGATREKRLSQQAPPQQSPEKEEGQSPGDAVLIPKQEGGAPPPQGATGPVIVAGGTYHPSNFAQNSRIKHLEEQLAVAQADAKKWKKKFVKHYSLSRISQHALERIERETMEKHDDVNAAYQVAPVPKRLMTLAGLSLLHTHLSGGGGLQPINTSDTGTHHGAAAGLGASFFSSEALMNSITALPLAGGAGGGANNSPSALQAQGSFANLKSSLIANNGSPSQLLAGGNTNTSSLIQIPQLETENPITMVAIMIPPTGASFARMRDLSTLNGGSGGRGGGVNAEGSQLDPASLEYGLTTTDRQSLSFVSDGILQPTLRCIREKANSFGLYEVKSFKDMLFFVVRDAKKAVHFASAVHESLLSIEWNEVAERELTLLDMPALELAKVVPPTALQAMQQSTVKESTTSGSGSKKRAEDSPAPKKPLNTSSTVTGGGKTGKASTATKSALKAKRSPSPPQPDSIDEANILKFVFRGPRVAITVEQGSPELVENTITGRTDYVGAPVNKTIRGLALARGGETLVSERVLSVLRKESRFLSEWAVVGKPKQSGGGSILSPSNSVNTPAAGTGGANSSILSPNRAANTNTGDERRTSVLSVRDGTQQNQQTKWSSILPHKLAPRFRWYNTNAPNSADALFIQERTQAYLDHFVKLKWKGVGERITASQVKDLQSCVTYRRMLLRKQIQQQQLETAQMLSHDDPELVDRTPPAISASSPILPSTGPLAEGKTAVNSNNSNTALQHQQKESGNGTIIAVPAAPSAAVIGGYCTLVVHDLEGSKALLDQLGEVFLRAQEIHNGLMLDCLRRNNGYLVRHNGYDAFMCAFRSVEEAVNYCTQGQATMNGVEWPAEFSKQEPSLKVKDSKTGQLLFHGPRVRMSITFGYFNRSLETVPSDPKKKNSDFTGSTVIQCIKQWRQTSGGDIRMNPDAMNCYLKACDESGDRFGAGAVLGTLHVSKKVDQLGVPQYFSLLPRNLAGRASRFPPPAAPGTKPKHGGGKSDNDYLKGGGGDKALGLNGGPGGNTWWKALWSLFYPVKRQPVYPVKRINKKAPASSTVQQSPTEDSQPGTSIGGGPGTTSAAADGSLKPRSGNSNLKSSQRGRGRGAVASSRSPSRGRGNTGAAQSTPASRNTANSGRGRGATTASPARRGRSPPSRR